LFLFTRTRQEEEECKGGIRTNQDDVKGLPAQLLKQPPLGLDMRCASRGYGILRINATARSSVETAPSPLL
jgi:hypothetical protein